MSQSVYIPGPLCWLRIYWKVTGVQIIGEGEKLTVHLLKNRRKWFTSHVNVDSIAGEIKLAGDTQLKQDLWNWFDITADWLINHIVNLVGEAVKNHFAVCFN